MSIRALFPNILSTGALPGARCSPLPRLAFRQAHTSAISISRSIPKSQSRTYRSLYTTATIGLGLSFLTYHSNRQPIRCDTSTGASLPRPAAAGSSASAGQAPESMLNVYQLTFGTVCGICTGVFLKKGLRAIAFLLGGVFVLMQYMNSRSFISVDWKRLASSYDTTFGTKTTDGLIERPTAGGAYNWIVDFVTANFQQRASFLAGLVLGVRLG